MAVLWYGVLLYLFYGITATRRFLTTTTGTGASLLAARQAHPFQKPPPTTLIFNTPTPANSHPAFAAC